LTFLSRSYESLKHEIAPKLQYSYLSYTAMKMLYFNLAKISKKPEDAKDDSYMKDFKKVFS
jgi:hypothetical protein